MEILPDRIGNVLSSPENIVPTGELGQVSRCRKYVRAKKIEALAVDKVRKNWQDDITITDLVTSGIVNSKRQAQRIIKYYYHERKILFTLKRTCPQKYYPSSLRAEINQRLRKNVENVLTDPTEVNPFYSPYSSDRITKGNSQNLLDILQSYSSLPVAVHKLQLMCEIPSEYYTDVHKEYWQKNKGKKHEEEIGSSLVKYVIYPNGRVTVFVTCSNKPFKLETEPDCGLSNCFFYADHATF